MPHLCHSKDELLEEQFLVLGEASDDVPRCVVLGEASDDVPRHAVLVQILVRVKKAVHQIDKVFVVRSVGRSDVQERGVGRGFGLVHTLKMRIWFSKSRRGEI